jgi:hypothetical protein
MAFPIPIYLDNKVQPGRVACLSFYLRCKKTYPWLRPVQQIGSIERPIQLDTGEQAVKWKSILVWAIVIVAAAGVTTTIFVLRARHVRSRATIIHGAVIRQDPDTHKQLPVADVLVTASNGTAVVSTQSDTSGFFTLTYPQILWPGRNVDLSFRRDGYMPLDIILRSGPRLFTRELTIARMAPLPRHDTNPQTGKPVVVSNIKIRYTVIAESADNIGSAVKTFQVANKGDVPCNHQVPCSPDGYWKAANGSVSLDAGQGNEFRSVRASCIAGPCPFTRIDTTGFVHGGRVITVSALDWSDTATFLVEAEVFHDSINSNVRQLYPVLFGDALHFTLPPTQEGVSFEAEIDGAPVVFPLSPDLNLSWASCTERADSDKNTVYRCELKPGYKF